MSRYFNDDDNENEEPFSDDDIEESSEEDDDNEEDVDDDEDNENEEDVDEIDDDEDMEGGALDSDVEDVDEGAKENEVSTKKTKQVPEKGTYNQIMSDDEDDDDDDDDGEQYLQKFDRSINENYLVNFHPENILQNYDEILAMTKVVRDDNGTIVDKLHRTIPFLTKYEKSRILGQRATQINSGATPFIQVPEDVIDGYIIAEMELKEKRIPFIIRRPLPNGGSEYWRVSDLENILF